MNAILTKQDLNPVFQKNTYKGITYAMMLDNRRHNGKETQTRNVYGVTLNLVVRIFFNRQYLYVGMDKDFKRDEFAELCEYQHKEGCKAKLKERNALLTKYNHVATIIKDLAGRESGDDNEFSFEEFKIKYYNLTRSDDVTIYTIWDDAISSKSVGTAASYKDAKSRFVKDMGKHVKFSDINKAFIIKWRTKMLSVLNKTSTNIYLRAFSVIVHNAYDMQLISADPKALFKDLSIRGKNSSESRKHEYLSVSDWQKLWEFYKTNGKGNAAFESWRTDYKVNNMEALGLLLFMYLANGMNLRDVCALRYDKFYFDNGEREMQFIRHKIADVTAQGVEFPILPEMRVILKRQANEEFEGGLVFPYLQTVMGNESEERRLTGLLNHVIRDRMKNVAKAVGLSAEITPTWARHSFATNLIQSGVAKDYVSWAMAHTDNGTTSTYIAAYSHEQMMLNNSLLLHPKDIKTDLLAQLQTLNKETLKELLKSVQQ
jgi:integrase